MSSTLNLPVREYDLHERVDIALVSMPWASPTEPSLGLGILKACLLKEHIPSRVFHMAPELLRWCTLETYIFLAGLWGINDLLFTGVVDAVVDEAQQQSLLDRVACYAKAKHHSRYPDTESILRLVWTMRDRVMPEFIEYTVHRILVSQPKLVGLTCLFDQTMASVALAKRLKEVSPELPIVLGGYALEGPPGNTVGTAFPWIDLIVNGDGERAIVDLAQDVLAGKNITARANQSARTLTTARVNLENSPSPDYDDWFLRVGENVGVELGKRAQYF